MTVEQETNNQLKEDVLLFKLSFRYSQGLYGLQMKIFDWLITKGYLSQLTDPTDPLFPSLLDIKPPTQHSTTTHDWETDQIAMVVKQIHSIPTEKRRKDTRKLSLQITKKMVAADLRYQKRTTGRKNRNSRIPRPDSENDPRSSFIRRYAFRNEPAGHTAFQALFQEICMAINNTQAKALGGHHLSRAEEKLLTDLTILQQLWEQNHPGETFFPNSLSTPPTDTIV